VTDDIPPRIVEFADWMREWWAANESRFVYMTDEAWDIVSAKAESMGLDLETSGCISLKKPQ
jgi:hypothetical protein